MKACKDILKRILKSQFNTFYTIDDVLRKVFNSYYDRIEFLSINSNNIMYIGVKIPHLLAHFTSLQKNILQQIKDFSFQISGIKFLYYSKKKERFIPTSVFKKKNFEEKKLTIYEQEVIHNIIVKNCPKDDYHDLLYKLYIKVVKK